MHLQIPGHNKIERVSKEESHSNMSHLSHRMKSIAEASLMDITSFMPVEIEVTEEQHEKLAILIAFIVGWVSGLTNTFVAILSERIEDKWLWATQYSSFSLWLIYHFYRWLKDNRQLRLRGRPTYGFFTKRNWAIYFHTEDYHDSHHSYVDTSSWRVNWTHVLVPVWRTIFTILVCLSSSRAWNYCALAGINSGIISTLFVTSILFATIFFFFVYDQKIGYYEFVGIFMVIGSVYFIATGNQKTMDTDQGVNEEAANQITHYKYLSVLFSIIVGFLFGLRAWESKLITTKTTISPVQANIDGLTLMGIVTLPMFIYYNQQGTYTSTDLFMSNFFGFTNIACTAALFIAYHMGRAGIITTIENTKNLWQVAFVIFLNDRIPTQMQIAGCLLGMLGLAVIVLHKKDQQKSPQTSTELDDETQRQDQYQKL